MVKSTSKIWLITNWIYLILFAVSGFIWLLQWNTFGVVIGVVAGVIAYFIFQRNRWAYFAAAIWCFGLLRIAMDDPNDFHQGWQAIVKVPYLIGVVFALILHEKIALKKPSVDTKNIPN